METQSSLKTKRKRQENDDVIQEKNTDDIYPIEGEYSENESSGFEFNANVSENLLDFSNYSLNESNTEFSPSELFESIFDNTILAMITRYTNKYLRVKSKMNHNEITMNEIKQFIIINIFFSIVNLPEKKLYWK